MYEAIFIAATAVQNQQRRVDTIADNVANVNTAAFKANRLDFKDALYTAGFGVPYTPEPEGNQQKGHGVMIAATTREFGRNGNVTVTGGILDFTIVGDGFFEVTDQNGDRLYTRAGNFYMSTEGNDAYLVTSDGLYVQNNRGGRIQIPEGTTRVSVATNGTMLFYAGDEIMAQEQMGIYTFTNKHGLSATGSSLFAQTETSGAKSVATGIEVRQGALEGSNVDLGTELTRLIRAQRAFSLASRALTTADDMEGIANNLRK